MSDINEYNEPTYTEIQNDLNHSKEVEFYSQSVAGWLNSALERDKSLLTLSSAGIGVLVSMMQTAIDSVCSLLLYVTAVIAFMISLISVLMIFTRNKKHILDVLNGQPDGDDFLNILDSTANFSFFIAMLLSAMLGISSAVTTYLDKGNTMANENPNKSTQLLMANDSVNGLGNVKPCTESYNHFGDLRKSYDSVAKLQAQSNSQSNKTTTTTRAQPSTSQKNQPVCKGK